MKSLRPSLLRRVRDLFKSRRERNDRRGRRPTLRFESLEQRVNMHYHAHLAIFLDGQQVSIPANIGVPTVGDPHLNAANPHTHDTSGELHIGEIPTAGTSSETRAARLDDFFDVWREAALSGGNNANAQFDSTRLMNRTADATHVVKMYVNGALNTEYQNYVMKDGDDIVLSYETVVSAGTPQFAPIETQTVLGGSPLWLAIDGSDPQNQNLTYTVTSSNPSLVTPTVYSGTTGLKVSVASADSAIQGSMEFRLFNDLAARAANRVTTLANQGFYNGVIFHRVIDGFMIQGGDPTGTGSSGSSLGNFDDQFNTELQHNRGGLLSFAKSSDDTNNSQFFITEVPTRHLDFNHSIFGLLVEGDNVREQISNVSTNSSNKPLSNVTMTSVTTFTDNENGVIKLKAAEGASGTANITVTARDPDGNTFSRTFQVTVTPDTTNTVPFLSDISAIRTTVNTPVNFTLQGQDVEGNAPTYAAVNTGANTPTVSVNSTTGLVTVTPPSNFVGTLNVRVGTGASNSITVTDPSTGLPVTKSLADAIVDSSRRFDSVVDIQNLSITVAPSAPTSVDLQDSSDSGRSNNDNNTNQTNALQFLVSGVTSGATVQLRAGNTVIGSATASSTSVVITTNVALTDGLQAITAVQTVNSIVSDPSAALNVTIDTASPAAFTSTPPVDGEVNTQLLYDAQNPEEKTDGTGVRYSLANAPAGASIDQNTGVLTWTPTSSQLGVQTFAINATDAAGNLRSQSLSVNVGSQKIVRFRVAITDKQFNDISTLNIGDEFLVRIFTKDLRTGDNTGVFAAYTDVTFDGTKAVRTSDAIVRGTNYQSATSGNTSSAGLFDELGGVAASLLPIGTNEFLVASVPMRAIGSGTLTFSTDAPDIAPDHNVLVYGNSATKQDIPASQISFGTDSVVINSNIGANPDLFNINEDTTSNSLDVILNDTKPANSAGLLSIGRVGTSSTAGVTEKGGTVTVSSDGLKVLYTPPAGFVGTDSFFYEALLGTDSSQAKADVQVANVNDAPTAVNNTATVTEDSPNNIIDVLANDTDPDTASGDKIKVTAVGTSPNGTVTIGPQGTHVVFTPSNNFIGNTSFTYTISDNAGATSTATVSVTVTPFNDPPTALADSFTVSEDSSLTNFNVLSNDSTAPDTGETLTITSVGTTNNGTVTISDGGLSIGYRPKANFQGTDSFTYTISDGNGGSATATVSVNVTNTNDPPDAVNDSATVTKNSSAQTINVLANDTSAPDPTENLRVQSVGSGSANGTITIAADGKSVLYAPKADFVGTETFTYVLSDGNGGTDTATVSVEVVNFRPSNLSGFVYLDANNDGVKQSTDSPVSGVTVVLTGTSSVNSQAVTQTVVTGADGSYSFANLPPGTYKIKETQPQFLLDGKETVGSQGGTATTNDEITITIPENTTGTGNNFGERNNSVRILNGSGQPIEPATASNSQVRFFDIRDRLASRQRNYMLSVVNPTTGMVWSSAGPGWSDVQVSNIRFVNNQTQLEITGKRQTGTASPVNVQATISATDKTKVQLVSQTGSDQMLRFIGPSSAFPFQTVTTSSGEGEGNSASTTSATTTSTSSPSAQSSTASAIDAVLSQEANHSTTDWIADYLSSSRRRSNQYESAVDAIMSSQTL